MINLPILVPKVALQLHIPPIALRSGISYWSSVFLDPVEDVMVVLSLCSQDECDPVEQVITNLQCDKVGLLQGKHDYGCLSRDFVQSLRSETRFE